MQQLIGQYLPWFIAFAGVFGVLIGSFLNVVIWRVPRGESLLPSSQCPKCGKKISALQNIPLLSWVFLRGKCANCGKKISGRYPLVELATGVIFAAVTFWAAGERWPVDSVAWWIMLAALLWFATISVALTIIDFELQRLPDAIVVPSLFVVLGLLILASLIAPGGAEWQTILTVFAGVAGMFALYFLIIVIAPNGMGAGDLKLAPVIGAMSGFYGLGALLVGAFSAFIFGAIFGLIVMIVKRGSRKTAIPFGPFMLLGAWCGIFWGEKLLNIYVSAFF